MFKDLSIKSKLTLGLGAIVAIMLFLLGLAYNNSQKLAEANKWDRHALEVLIDHFDQSALGQPEKDALAILKGELAEIRKVKRRELSRGG